MFFYNRDNAEYDCFPASGRRDSIGIVYFYDKLRIAANFNSSSIRLLSGGLRPNLAQILYLITKRDILLTSLLFIFILLCKVRSLIPLKKNDKHLMCLSFFFGAGDGIRTRDFHLGKVAFYH